LKATGQDEEMKKIDRNFAALWVATVACCLVFGLAASAATAPAAAPPSAAAKLAAAGDEPAKVAAARDFIMLAHPRTDPQNTAQMLDKVMPRMIAAAKRQDPKLDAKKYEKDTRARMMTMATDRLDLQAHIVSRHFTLQELKDLKAFYGSPIGRKLTAETPKIQMEVMISKPRILPRGNSAKPMLSGPQKTPAPDKVLTPPAKTQK
jgi:hypothetical protein